MNDIDRELAEFVSTEAFMVGRERHNELAAQPIAEGMDPKMVKNLEKLRKGSVGFIGSWKKMGEVLQALGPKWKLEPIVGFVHNKEGYGNKVFDESEDEIQAAWDYLSKKAVTSLPAKPKHQEVYVRNMSPITSFDVEYSDSGKRWMFHCDLSVGADGWRVTAPDGKTFDALPSHHDMGDILSHRGYTTLGHKFPKRNKLTMFPLITWLNKETHWQELAAQALNLDPHQPAAKRTRGSTGSCPVCFQNIKAKPNMVLHGYKRPGHGFAEGNCYGKGFPPFEVDVKGTKAYLEKVLMPALSGRKQDLARLKSGKVKELPNPASPKKKIDSSHPSWKYALDSTISKIERNIEFVEADVKAFTNLIRKWKKRPLPKEGEPHIDWFIQGQR